MEHSGAEQTIAGVKRRAGSQGSSGEGGHDDKRVRDAGEAQAEAGKAAEAGEVAGAAETVMDIYSHEPTHEHEDDESEASDEEEEESEDEDEAKASKDSRVNTLFDTVTMERPVTITSLALDVTTGTFILATPRGLMRLDVKTGVVGTIADSHDKRNYTDLDTAHVAVDGAGVIYLADSNKIFSVKPLGAVPGVEPPHEPTRVGIIDAGLCGWIHGFATTMAASEPALVVVHGHSFSHVDLAGAAHASALIAGLGGVGAAMPAESRSFTDGILGVPSPKEFALGARQATIASHLTPKCPVVDKRGRIFFLDCNKDRVPLVRMCEPGNQTVVTLMDDHQVRFDEHAGDYLRAHTACSAKVEFARALAYSAKRDLLLVADGAGVILQVHLETSTVAVLAGQRHRSPGRYDPRDGRGDEARLRPVALTLSADEDTLYFVDTSHTGHCTVRSVTLDHLA